jgi:transcription-repair coupling factor (superfamily II helicase)
VASVDDPAEIERIRAEVADRFGPAPATVENLFRYGTIKHFARRLRIGSIDRSDGRVVFRFLPGTPVDWGRVPPLLKRHAGSLSPEGVMSLGLRAEGERELLDETVRVLMELSG